VAVQGNLDPLLLLAPREKLFAGAQKVLDNARGASGHIFNLGHGIIPETPLENVQALADFVHEASARSA
jgi:uroporphyrinogen decarboxylase